MAEVFHVPFAEGERLRVRGGLWRIDRIRAFASCAALSLQGTDAATFGTTRTFLIPFDRPSRPARRSGFRVVRRRRGLRTLADAVVGCHPYGGLRAAAAARIDLLAFQLEPALAVCRGLTQRLLLADEVGLGKTIQAGLVLAELHARGEAAHTLIVVPSGIRDQWATELSTHFGLACEVVDLASLTTASARVPAGTNPWAVPGVRIVSLDFIKRPEVLVSLSELVWDVLVVDEAHHLGPATDRGSAARMLALRSRHVLLLTATPHAGSDAEFESLCAIGAASQEDGPMLMFRRTRAGVGLPVDRRVGVVAVSPTGEEARMHGLLDEYARQLWSESRAAESGRAPALRLLASVLYKRAFSSASSLLLSLRRRLELLTSGDSPGDRIRPATLPFEEFDDRDEVAADVLGVRGTGDWLTEAERLRALIRIAELASRSESKLRVVRALLRRRGERLILFTEYRDTLARLADEIAPVSFAVLHGGLTRRERRAAAERFTRGEVRVLLTTDAGGEGLNLQHDCRWLVCLEVPWSPLRLEQRIGRVDRLGQRQRVHALTLVARHTPEHHVLARMVSKLTRARRSLGDQTLSLGALTEDAVVRSLLEGGRIDSERPAIPPPYRVVDLSHAATVERTRLVQLRRLASGGPLQPETKLKLGPTKRLRAPKKPEPTGVLIIRPPRRARRPELQTALFIFRTHLRDGTGSVVDDLILPIVMSGTLPRLDHRSDSQVRQVIAAISSGLTFTMDQLLAGAIRQRIHDVIPIHGQVVRVRLQSEARIAAVLAEARTLAAGRSGQGSLFYRTADETRADQLGDRLEAAARRQDLRRARLSAAEALSADSPELIAVFPL